MIIDAHHHFWQVARGDYEWLTPDIAPLYRDFLPRDLAPLLTKNGVDGTILVQAAQTIAETEFMLRIADDNPFVLGVVGWIDFEAPTAATDIARLAAHPKLVGLRPMIQDIADDDWMLGRTLTPAFEAIIAHDLAFDALVYPRHLCRLVTLLQRHPGLRTVVDHGAKPQIADRAFDVWAEDIAQVARRTSAYCKLSGLLTEADTNWSPADIKPYINHLLDVFGPDRLVWGSDWPVLTLASDYRTWMDLARASLGDDPETQGVLGANAQTLYKL